VHGVRGADRDDMLVDMIPVHVVEMAVMKIVNMAVMANGRVSAVRAMLVDMVGMVPLVDGVRARGDYRADAAVVAVNLRQKVFED
jgi:hypothetical protein